MTPDVDAIRAALAAATPAPWEIAETGLDEFDRPFHRIGRPEMSIEDDIAQVWSDNKADDEFAANGALVANAPVWLASLVSEVERLRAVVESQAEHIGIGDQIAEEDKAEIERLQRFRLLSDSAFAVVVAERAAALAECERLRNECDSLRDQLPDRFA